jgi:16S rRNA (guanine527-N7)-methyltransferase
VPGSPGGSGLDVGVAVREVLAESARLGFLGPGSMEPAVLHAAGFLPCLRPAASVLDLGAGGGLPGLVLAALTPDTEWVLLDASQRRTDFLRRAVGRLGWGGRVRVVTGRAEAVVDALGWRGAFDAVVSRGFGPPATTAECAAGLLRLGGQLVVSEPPEADDGRWPADGLARLGLRRDHLDTFLYASFTPVDPCPASLPRRRLRPPLF